MPKSISELPRVACHVGSHSITCDNSLMKKPKNIKLLSLVAGLWDILEKGDTCFLL